MFARCAPGLSLPIIAVTSAHRSPTPPRDSARVKHVTTPQVGEEPAHSPLPMVHVLGDIAVRGSFLCGIAALAARLVDGRCGLRLPGFVFGLVDATSASISFHLYRLCINVRFEPIALLCDRG